MVGDEHYLDDLKHFCCYGEPLFDPTSGRLEGVLDITGPLSQSTTMLGPFLARARNEIERRLLETSRTAHQLLLRAYEAAAHGARHPVVALADDMMVANPPAMAQLSRVDLAVLRSLVADGARDAAIVRLASDAVAQVECSPVAPNAAVLALRVCSQRSLTVSGTSPTRPARSRVASSVLVIGEAGTGRSTEIRNRVPPRTEVFSATDGHGLDDVARTERIRQTLTSGQDVVIEDLHVLSPAASGRLRSVLVTHRGQGRVFATCGPLTGLGPDLSALAAMFEEHVSLRPLREDRGRIPLLVQAGLVDMTGPDGPRAGPALIEHLASLPWPGNLSELRRVVEHLAGQRADGELEVADLPLRYREAPWRRSLTPLERSEYETIVTALRQADGNKLQAARTLGISRGTLYARLRRFKIST